METNNKNVTIAILGFLIVALLAAIFFSQQLGTPTAHDDAEDELVVEETLPATWPEVTTIGFSVDGRSIEAYRFGTGAHRLLFVGGIHGGYEWNSSLLAWQFIDYLTINPDEVPSDISITIIPALNPDGLALVTGKNGKFDMRDIADPSTRVAAGRLNANAVDLNRNFACKWQPESTWRGTAVNAGSAAFSEPESQALRDFVLSTEPEAVVFWHSQANNVYASECEEGILPETLVLMNSYATAGKYGAVASFDAYPVTGDAEGWLASINIPAVTVELETHNDIEWTRNLAGTMAVIDTYTAIAK